MNRYTLLSVLLITLWTGSGFTASGATSEDLHSAMAQYLTCLPLPLVNLEQQEISISNEELCLATIYSAIGMKPLWVSENGPHEKAADIFFALMNVEKDGLYSGDYDVKTITSLWKSRKAEQLAQLDTLLTLNLIKYAHNVSHGRILPYHTDPELFAEAGDKHFNPVQTVKEALSAKSLPAYLAGLPPSHAYYKRLRQALQEFRDKAKTTRWEPIASGKTIHPGDRNERIALIRKRLTETGHAQAGTSDGFVYDNQLVPAVKEFQKQFGLKQDGIIGRNTMSALNFSPADTINAIILNMARWRWHEHELGQRYVMVNIANYHLMAVDNCQEALNMAVIVGQLNYQTPVFSDRIRYLDFNPFWNIPPSIARNEELPELQKDPHYLTNRHVRLFSGWQSNSIEVDSTRIDWTSIQPREINRYRLRQDPGPWNALGRVKFIFPNKYDIYLHDTPAHNLFEQTERTFSHGCIRVSYPLKLAEFVLQGQKEQWPMERIEEVVTKGEKKTVALSSPLPVHITYQTVWVDNHGKIHFNNDTYGRDKILAEILFHQKNNSDLPGK